MAIELNPNEIRVLGVLIEKSMTGPQYYPMTLNSIVVACNQKNNRDPVLSLTEGEVAAAVHGLQRWQLASIAPPEPGSRANKFLHEAEKRLGWTTSQRAIMSELMIRGPQTVGELRTNCSRMTRMDAIEYVREVLAELERLDPPMVRELPRQRGQSATRFAQLLGGPVTESPEPDRSNLPPTSGVPAQDRLGRLEAELEELRAEVHSLHARLRNAGLLE